ncbi:MAG: hypothetical protein HY306_01825 [Nitrosomonadales bacterium]|nr:hypothetical protein [Nitrosomonadales bacterium]
MFGFGRSANEKYIISQFEPTLLRFGHSPAEAKKIASGIFDKVKYDLQSRGIDLYKTDQGSIYAKNQDYMALRLKAGLTVRDIESFWNRHIVVILCEEKNRELNKILTKDARRDLGQDSDSFEVEWRKFNPCYGDPAKFEQWTMPYLCESNADIYIEFAKRIEIWASKTPDTEVIRLVTEEYSTFNQMVRDLVSKGLM